MSKKASKSLTFFFSSSNGFTLLEILASLALCAFLVAIATAAISISLRVEQRAIRENQAILHLHTAYTLLHLNPDVAAQASWPDEWSLRDESALFTPSPSRLSYTPREVAKGPSPSWNNWILVARTKEIPPLTVPVFISTK